MHLSVIYYRLIAVYNLSHKNTSSDKPSINSDHTDNTDLRWKLSSSRISSLPEWNLCV